MYFGLLIFGLKSYVGVVVGSVACKQEVLSLGMEYISLTGEEYTNLTDEM